MPDFTQSSITEVFAGGEHQRECLDKTIAELREKPSLRLEYDSFTLESARYKGRLRVINNRRLCCPRTAMSMKELSATRHLSRALALSTTAAISVCSITFLHFRSRQCNRA